MGDKLNKMVELVKGLKLGQIIPYKGLSARVTAFNDEGVFLAVDEIKVSPDEFEGVGADKRVKDKRLEEAERHAFQLRNEIDKLLSDPSYYEYRRKGEDRYRHDLIDRYKDRMDGLRMMMSPQYTGIYGGGEFTFEQPLPKKEIWIDPLSYKSPSQKKG